MWPIFSIGSMTVPTYTLTISLICTFIIIWFARRAEAQGQSSRMALDLSAVVLICGFIGARLFHVLYEDHAFYIDNPEVIVQVWRGGFVFFGGLLGAVLGALAYLRWKAESFAKWADLAAPLCAIGYGLGRLACFFEGCCYGEPSHLPWAMRFPVHQYWGMEAVARHPTQLYAAGLELLIAFYLFRIEARIPKAQRQVGYIFWTWLALHGVARMFNEVFRQDPRGNLILGMGISFWIGALLVILAGLRLKHPTLSEK